MNSANDGGATATCTRDDGEALEQSDLQRGNRAYLVDGLDGKHLVGTRLVVKLSGVVDVLDVQAPITSLEHDEDDAVENEHRRDDPGVVQVLGHPVIEEQADDGRGNAADDDHAPQTPSALALRGRLLAREGIELREVEDDHGHDRPDLDHDEEELEEGRRHVELDEFVDENHVTRRGDRQPFGQPLDKADEKCLERFDEHVVVP